MNQMNSMNFIDKYVKICNLFALGYIVSIWYFFKSALCFILCERYPLIRFKASSSCESETTSGDVSVKLPAFLFRASETTEIQSEIAARAEKIDFSSSPFFFHFIFFFLVKNQYYCALGVISVNDV